ncbi:MAG: FAD:protein FMN transferase [Acetatifactor sp.]|nr:FAD:protein FMN transferase [Acetatifactor sp.]
MKRFFRRLLRGLIPALTLFLCSCGQEVQELQSVDIAMGTVIQQTIYVTGKGAQTENILHLIQQLEEETLSWRLETAEIFQVNQYAGSGKWLELSEKLSRILEQCQKLTEDTDGAFDVALGPVARLWDIDGWAGGQRTGMFQVPEVQALEQAVAQCGFERLNLQFLPGEKCAIVSLEEGAAMDLGAVGKGLALDEIFSYLKTETNVKGAVVSVGGSVLTYGEKPDGTAWRVGIANPHDPSVNLGVLTLTGQWYISTSGDYERYMEFDGVRYHHIMDPATGYPADSGLSSVTVLADNGLLSDGLSTACFVLGREKGMLLAQQYGAEALFVEKDGGIFTTPGMDALFQTMD